VALNSWQFVVLAVLVSAFMRLAPGRISRKLVLLGSSLIFLSSYLSSTRAGVVLAALLIVIYMLGMPLIRTAMGWSSRIVVLVIVALWGFLFLVKDPNLFVPINPFHFAPVAIIGISYLVFRGISYLMEADLAPNAGVVDFLNYMIFFPTLLAGPIERYEPFVSRYGDIHSDRQRILPAIHRIANGYIKKFVIADNLTAFSVAGIADPTSTTHSVLWIAALLQLLLIYLDFSGYSDIAIGVASLMGIRIRENFNRPFASVNIREFWERWHMSMSSLLRDYVFTPTCKVILSTPYRSWHWPMVTATYCMVMVLVALWHGTTLGFLVFGLLHASVLVVVQVRQVMRPKRAPALTVYGKVIWAATTYAFVSISLVLWMAPGGRWLEYYAAMLGVR
jgi:alginate O-acetyltransferase complex protein AlgI